MSKSPIIVAHPPPRPLMVFDGDCSFCKRWVERWRWLTLGEIDFEPYQSVASQFPEIPTENFHRGVQVIETDGWVTKNARAVFRSFDLAKRKRWLLWLYENIPPFALLSECVYRFIANHRNGLDKLDRWALGTKTTPTSYVITREVFLRLLGVIYLIAFVSYFVQIDGLIGHRGIRPIAGYLQFFRENAEHPYAQLPTLLWFNSSDAMLHGLCISGIVAACLLIIGLVPIPALVVLWVNYLSLVVGGQEFLSFQWDALLLEAGLLAIFFAPWRIGLRLSRARLPSNLTLFLLRWLVFRLMFLSGLVKLTFGDVTWRSWEVFKYHYETQPIPTWTSWYFQHLPIWFQWFSLAFMYLAELVAPFFIFFPRRLRFLAFAIIVLLQMMIAATGNYGFFNLLATVLCFPLLDDSIWPTRWQLKLTIDQYRAAIRNRWFFRHAVLPVIACVIVIVTSMQIVEAYEADRIDWPAPLAWLEAEIDPIRSVNSYGLFRVMTRQRPEIIVEGSADGETWKPYIFKWKAGPLDRAPGFCTPHMPRLDWQMWFAALSNYQYEPWFMNFMVRLLQGSPPVLELLKENPFPDHPPQYVRAVLYDYHFTTAEERKQTGNWWKRELRGLYCPVISRDQLREKSAQ
ncbi:MAG TPA: lipase maturation factor family protein [Tepidisphaeraceae bacterium]|nr:lipase maturation factor family protein [Tepidisphaeraceae bacterium]